MHPTWLSHIYGRLVILRRLHKSNTKNDPLNFWCPADTVKTLCLCLREAQHCPILIAILFCRLSQPRHVKVFSISNYILWGHYKVLLNNIPFSLRKLFLQMRDGVLMAQWLKYCTENLFFALYRVYFVCLYDLRYFLFA